MNAIDGGFEVVPRATLRELPVSAIREISRAGAGIDDLIPLWFGEPHEPTPAFIREAARAALAAGETFYTPNRGIPELRAALAGYQRRVRGAAVTDEHVTVTVSGLNALTLALQALLEPGDHVVTLAPLWVNFHAMPPLFGARTTLVPLDADAQLGWRLDLDRLFDACGPDTRMLLLNSPANPHGWTLSIEEQRAILEFARSRGIWIVSDEVYGRLYFAGDCAPSFATLMEEGDRILVVDSFSKTWAMTGWRLGWITAPAALGKELEKLIEYNVSCAPAFTQRAGVAAVEQGEGFVAGQREHYRAMRDLALERLGAIERVRFTSPPASFYAFFAVDGAHDSRALALRLIADARVGLAPGVAFGDAGEGWLRLCFAAPRARLEEAFDRLAPALA